MLENSKVPVRRNFNSEYGIGEKVQKAHLKVRVLSCAFIGRRKVNIKMITRTVGPVDNLGIIEGDCYPLSHGLLVQRVDRLYGRVLVPGSVGRGVVHNRPEVVRDVEALGAAGLQELRAVVVEVVPVDCDVGVPVLALLLVPEAQGVGDLMHWPSCHLRIVTSYKRFEAG